MVVRRKGIFSKMALIQVWQPSNYWRLVDHDVVLLIDKWMGGGLSDFLKMLKFQPQILNKTSMQCLFFRYLQGTLGRGQVYPFPVRFQGPKNSMKRWCSTGDFPQVIAGSTPPATCISFHHFVSQLSTGKPGCYSGNGKSHEYIRVHEPELGGVREGDMRAVDVDVD